MSMYIGSYIICSAMIVIIIFSPFVFNTLFNNNKFIGFWLGLLCSFITFFISSIVALIFFLIIFIGLKNKIEKYNDKDEVSIEDYLHQPAIILILVYIMIFLIESIFFIILYFFIKRILNLNYINKTILMFISGYTFLFIGFYIFLSTVSLSPENYEENHKLIGSLKQKILLIIDIIISLFILKLVGTIFMIFLYHKEVNDKLIFLCIGIYIIPFIFYIFGFAFHKDYILFYPTEIINFICFLVGIIFYYLFYKYKQENKKKEIYFPQESILPEE